MGVGLKTVLTSYISSTSGSLSMQVCHVNSTSHGRERTTRNTRSRV